MSVCEKDQRTRPNQSGFRLGRGCTDQMHNLCVTLEQRWSFQEATVMCFVGSASAFDSVDRDSLWRIMVVDGALEPDHGVLRANQVEG